jgi:glycosyltransferase involved in cell wall biosynthesis
VRRISVIVPVFDEQDVLPEFHRRLLLSLGNLDLESEIVYIDDGSRDGTALLLAGFQEHSPRCEVIHLSRNFGKEAAMTAGLDHVSGDAVVIIDADLQDPPELIPELVRQWRELGHDVVYAQRRTRRGETWIRRGLVGSFYWVMSHLGEAPLPPQAGDFRLLSRPAVDALRRLPERHRFMKGLFTWVGFSQIAVPYDRDPRYSGRSKWNYRKLWRFSVEGITSFSTMPLRIASGLGFLIAFVSGLYGVFLIARRLLEGADVPGYTSLMVVILFLGGVQLITLGILGEYVGRTFNEVKRRPLYLISKHRKSRCDELKSPSDGGAAPG